MLKNVESYNTRNSNIEILKIISMVLIIACHVVAELTDDDYVQFSDFVFTYYIPSKDMSHLLLTIIHQMGYLGNTIFFSCSAWFLVDDNKIDNRKIIQLFIDIEIISVIFLIGYSIITGGVIDKKLALKMLFPHTFRLFWYLTCYFLFYFMHTHINSMINSMNKQTLLRSTLFLSLIFIFYDFLVRWWYFANVLISWVTLYFVIAYLKHYLSDTCRNIKTNIVILLLGILGTVTVPLFINIVATTFDKLANVSLGYFDDISVWNPFHIMVAVSLLNIALTQKFKSNRYINYIASLSLLMFVVHSNRIMRCYVIPTIWHKIYSGGGMSIL